MKTFVTLFCGSLFGRYFHRSPGPSMGAWSRGTFRCRLFLFLLLPFLLLTGIRVSAQLTLNGTPLLSSPGTYSGAIALPAEAVLSVAGSGDYLLSGVISDRVVQHPTLLPMTSETGSDYLGGMIMVTTSSAYDGDYQGWKSISNSPSGEWVTRQRTDKFWLQVRYAVPVIITSAQLRSRSGNSPVARWGIEGSVDGTAWRELYSSTGALPDNAITVNWENTTAYTCYRFYGLSSNARNPRFNTRNPGLTLFQLLGDRTSTPSTLTVQAGSGKIILTGANTYSGTTTLTSGTLQAGNGGTTGTLGTGAIINNAVLKINRSNELTLSNPVSGSGSFIQQGSGTTILTAANTYTGGTTLNGGILKAGHLTALGTGAVAINSGTTLDLRGGFSSVTNTLNNSGGTILRDDGLYLNNVLLTSNAGTPYSADMVLTQNSTLTQVGTGTCTLSGVISGDYALTSDIGAGNTLLLTGANTYSGTTTLTSGTLQTGNGGTTGTLGTGAIINNAVLKMNRSDELTLSNPVSGSGSFIQQGTGKTILTAANTYTGGTTLNGGILKAGHLTALGTGAVAINSGTTLDLRGGFSAVTNTLNNSGGTILRDDGLYLNNVLLTSNAGTPYSADIVLTQNSTLLQAGAGTYTLSGVISGDYGITSEIGEGHTLLLTGANTYSGTTTLISGTLQTGNGGTTGTLGTGGIINYAVLKMNRSNEITLSNLISGSGSLIQQGNGKTILTAANTYSGGTTLNGGILKAGHLTALGTGAVAIHSGTTLDLRGDFNNISNPLNNSGGTILRNDGLYLNDIWLTSPAQAPYSADIVLTQNSTFTQVGTGTCTLSGAISGDYAITSDIGAGNTLLLTGANTYSGTTTLTSGTLQTGDGGTTGTLGTGAIINNAVLKINRSNELTLSNPVSGSGSLIQQGSGKTILTAANTYSGGTTLNGGILKAGQLTALGTGAVAIHSGTTLDLRGDFNNIGNTLNNSGGTILRNDGLYLNDIWLTSAQAPYSADIVLTQNSTFTQVGTGTCTLSGVISGGYGITSDIGAGNTLLLTGANTYSGTTTLTSGTLQTGNGGTTGTLGTGAIINNAVLKINRSNEFTLSNPVSGSGSLIQQGSGKTILTAANTYTGGTTLNGGILKAGHRTALSTGAVAIHSGTTLDLRGGFSSLTNTLNNSGGTILRDDGLYLNNVLLTSNAGTPYSANIVLTQNSTLLQAGGGTYTLSGVISGGYGITSEIGEGNTLLLTGANTYSGTTTLTSGTLQTGNGGTTGTLGTGGIINYAVLKMNRSNEITLSNLISGSGSLIQQGSGKTILTAANTYTGGTTLNGGILKAGDLASFGTGPIALNTGTVLDLTGGLGNIANTTTNSGGTILRDNGLFLNGEWLTSNTQLPYSADIVLTQNSTLTQLAAGTYTLSGVISGDYALTSDIGEGNTLLLTGANTYSGTTTLTSGTLQTGNGGTTGTLGTGAIINNAVLKINRSNEITLSNPISGSGALIQQGSGKTLLTAANTCTGATTVAAGELSISGSTTSPVTVKSGALLSSGVNGTISNAVLLETGAKIQGGSGAPGTLTINGLLTLQNNTVLNVYSSTTAVSKIETNSPAELGAMTVNLKTPMTAGTYTLLQPTGSGTGPVTPGENSSTLYCVSYSWESNGLQVTVNNNTPIADAALSGGGTLTSAASTGLSAVLSASQTGVTYTLYKTLNTLTSEAATTAGTGQALTFDNLGQGVYTVKGSKDNCIRPMSGTVTITTDGTAIKDLLAQNNIPEAVKLTLIREAPDDKHTLFYLSQLYPDFQANVIGDCSDPGYYYAGFQLSYDGSDQNTVADWAARLSISLIKGATTTKLTDSLKVDLGTQTFETTTFFKDSICCADNYQFKINSKVVRGKVPAGAVRLFIRLYKVPSARPEMLPTASVNFTCVKENNTIRAAWLNNLPGVDEYDLEWTFIDHYDNYTSGNEAAFTFQEPVRVTVKGMEYTHQVYYPRGKIYYRIRPVGHQKANPAQRIAGAWTYKESPIEITNHDTGRTWQQQTIFAEEGKYKKVMSYYDATGRVRQQQTNLSSENATLTTETLYDFEGRKALTLMPAPERGNSLLFKSNLNPFMTGAAVQPFTSATQKKYHYDNGRLANSLLDSAATGGAGYYYSANNTLTGLHRNYIPKAEGYAYTQTEYTRDGTGRISRQSGPGRELNIDGSHALRYYYGSAAPEELDRLFGNKVGKAAHYKKDVTVDANGQATVTYKDQEGRTIATALAGAPPANVENLTSYPQQVTPVSLNLTGRNSKNNGLSETVHTFINASPNSEMTINYSWSAQGVQLPTLPPQCTACGYQLTLELTDPNGAKVNLGNARGDEDPGPSYRKTRTALSCTANADTTMQFTQVVLAEIGDYTLRKTLTPTILSYQQLRETVKQLTTTAQYRETLSAAHPASYEACQDCETCNKDSLINASIREVAQKTCQQIRDTIEANYIKAHPGTTMPDDYLNNESNNKLICKYNYCISTRESTVFDTQLAMIKDWTAAGSKSLSTAALVMAADPFFAAPANRRSLMTTKMGQVGIRNFAYDSSGYADGKKEKNKTRDILGQLEAVTDPANTTYYIDEYGRASASGKHFLYYDLNEKLAKNEITRAEYNERLGQQRWTLFRQYYSEGKRQIKLEETTGCDSMQAELRKQEALPKTQEEIIDRAKKQTTDADQWINAKMTLLAFKSSCAPRISSTDSTAISRMLYRYFKSTPYNYMGVIDEKDSAIDPATNKCKNLHLDSVRVRLETNYPGCRLSEFANQNPFECLKDTTIYIDEPEPSTLRSQLAPRAMSLRTERGADREGLRERGLEEERTRRMEEERGSETEEPKNIGGKNAFLQLMATATQPLTPAAEVNALIDLYNSTNGNQWYNTYKLWYPAKSGTMPYVTAPADISNWQGITLDAEGHVVELRLGWNNLIGPLPVLGQLPNLETVDLDYNHLSGSLANLSACTKLKYLSIENNQLSGSLDVLGQLPNLEILSLSVNNFSGSLANLSACTKLKWLYIPNNQLSGSLDVLGQLPNLEDVSLHNNKFSGSLANLSACTKLRELYLPFNQLSGSLDVLGQLPNLEILSLSVNNFSGSLANLSACTKLKELYIYSNQLSGSLDVLGHLPNLEIVYLGNNNFSGSLSGLSACTKLRWLIVSQNKFTFSDLEGLAGRTFTYGFEYSSQATIDTGQNIPCKPGESITLTTSIDRNTTTPCKYQWFKIIGYEETPLNAESVTGHTCSFTPQSADKGAEFYYTITNSNFPDLILTSHVRKLKLAYTYCLKYRLHPNAPAAKLWDFDTEAQTRKCRATQEAIAAGVVDRLVNTYIEEKTSQLILKSDSTCLKNAAETLGITYTNREHHYTLYYYDQAGNLVQTVPPQGVQIATTGNPAHTLKTTYRYNAQNQVIGQTTPDAGTSRFYYNKKGQLRFSQNAQQALDGRHAYTKYDAQGRITETGEASQTDLTKIEEADYPQGNRTDVTYTHYDAPARRSPLNQKYLRSRVSYTETIEKDATDTTRTYYSYDPHGSVNILLQKLPGLPPKTTHYRYDLVSGKVNYVFYQYKKPDQFVHRYTYDSDNRIREVFTSTDRYVWHKDATYRYYLHGPLATTELGHWRNQALNYTYTLQGWIKGVNTIETTDNMVGKSVMSYQLGYYKNDYRPIGATQNNVTLWTRAQENIAHQGMYNGNISWMETDLKLFKKPQAMLYKYDQLNRITKSRSLEFSNGNYAARTGDKKYDENYSYDANGNILTLKRHDDKAALADDFNYSYYPNSNKLEKHKTTGGTYLYDAIGNLITDNNENLQIAWTPSGKVRSVTKTDTIIYFRYDATGNRIAKIVSTTTKKDTTIYVRDASGNVMTIYRNRAVSEVPIYGSSRIGEYMGKEKEGYQTFNLRKYEITNHLGNVLVVISDKVKLYSRNKITLDSARAEVVSASDYYPFGLPMKGRQFNEKNYRYSFNGKENDNEFNWQDYGMRMYMQRICRFPSVDPLTNKYPHWTPYQFAGLNPIQFVDLDGAEPASYDFTKGRVYPASDQIRSNHPYSNAKQFNKGTAGSVGVEIPFVYANNALKGTVSGLILFSTASIMPVINQTKIIVNEGVHEGRAYNSKNKVDWAVPYDMPEWGVIEPHKQMMKDNIKPEDATKLIDAVITVLPIKIPFKAPLLNQQNKSAEFILNEVYSDAFGEGAKAAFLKSQKPNETEKPKTP